MAKRTRSKDPSFSQIQYELALPIYQIRISLRDIEPPIWRRIQTSDCTLDDLHQLIQLSFGWFDDHAHVFQVGDTNYSPPRGFPNDPGQNSQLVLLSELVSKGYDAFEYEYDFGDSWRHDIVIEAAIPAEPGVSYPRCVDGQRNAPPEDCGGPHAYPYVLRAMTNGEGSVGVEFAEILEQVPYDFDPEHFDLQSVNASFREFRGELGWKRSELLPPPEFQEGDLIRVKRGVVHAAYPDIPLGGWTGKVLDVNHLIPIGYNICWTDETLDAAHPVYFQRCQRDAREPRLWHVEQPQIETASDDDPLEIEQPAEIRTAPLSADDSEDRVRMIFGLTSDDPLPRRTPETDRIYYDYLSANMQFPMITKVFFDDCEIGPQTTIMGLAPIDQADLSGFRCVVKDGQPVPTVGLCGLLAGEDEPNAQLIEDYRLWVFDIQDLYDDEDELGDADASDDDEEEGLG